MHPGYVIFWKKVVEIFVKSSPVKSCSRAVQSGALAMITLTAAKMSLLK